MHIDRVGFRYNRASVFEDVSLTVPPGALVAVIGPNGAGKSTLLKLMAGILRPTKGRIGRTGRLGYLPQLATLQRDFPLTVRQVAATGLWPRLGDFGRMTSAHHSSVDAALAQVGLLGMHGRLLAELSGGQFQRLMLARLILEDAPTILLDEPFTGIDAAGREILLRLLAGWRREKRTVLCVLHDLALVEQHFPDLILIGEGRAELGQTTILLSRLKLRMTG